MRDKGDLFEAIHSACEAPWLCLGCGKQVCPRCEPSPAEQELCSDCWWTDDPGGIDEGSAA